MIYIVQDAPNRSIIGQQFDIEPGSEIAGEGWVIVECYYDDGNKSCFGYCTDLNCNCSGSISYY